MPEPSRRLSLVPLNETFLTPGDGATEILLVRHGQQESHAAATDRRNPPLSAVGRRQAKVVAAALADEDLAAVYSSSMSRARDTGAAIAAHHDLKAEEVPGIEEIGIFRDLEASQTAVLADERFKAGAAAVFARERRWDVYPLSESSAEFRRRVVTAIEGIVADHPGEVVVVACHGGVINTYLGWMLGIDADMWFHPAHASISRFRALDSQRALVSCNERAHLWAVDPALVTHDATG